MGKGREFLNLKTLIKNIQKIQLVVVHNCLQGVNVHKQKEI